MEKFENESTFQKFLESGKEEEFDHLFDQAVENVKSTVLGKEFPLFMGGNEMLTKEKMDEFSPIDKLYLGKFQKADRETARQAIQTAALAFESWKTVGYKERVRIFRNAADIFSREKFKVAAILSIENGKSRYESVGEVDEAIDFLRYYSYELEKNKGYSLKKRFGGSESAVSAGFQGAPGVEEAVEIRLLPYGVFGVIAPFNFPISISVGMSTGAMITGNTVIFKPSASGNSTMLTGHEIAKIFKEAGIPPGVFNYVTGSGSEVGDELVINPSVNGVVFTGSRSVGLDMIKKSAGLYLNKVFIVEMGGKNPAIVSKYADLDTAVDGIASSAFGFAGQKCSACSRVFVHEAVKDEFLKKLIEKLKHMKIGDPLKKGNFIGPLIGDGALKTYKEAVDEASKSGKVVYGGKQVEIGLKGIYVEPAVAVVPETNVLFHKELFVPFLSVDSYKRFSDVMKKANDVEYGLTAGLYTKKRSEIKEFLKSIQAGVIYINRRIGATTGAIVGVHSFVGWKGSGLTGKGTGSKFYLQQFMHEQSRSISLD